jgi:hypothetical protein
MKVTCPTRLHIFIAILILVTLACSSAMPKPQATDTPQPPPTNTPKPSSTPKPTNTPNMAATQKMEDAHTKIQSYFDAGYLSTTDGDLYDLDDYNREMAKIGFLDFNLAGYDDTVRDFVVWANVKWENAGPVGFPQYSGCGFSFRFDPDTYDGYTAMLTNDRVLLTYCDSSIHRCGEIGKTRGKGVLNLSNPAEANMELIVNDTQAYVLVDGEFIGEYTLFTEKMLNPGYILYAIISGTNKGYGVRCEITDSHIWTFTP